MGGLQSHWLLQQLQLQLLLLLLLLLQRLLTRAPCLRWQGWRQ